MVRWFLYLVVALLLYYVIRILTTAYNNPKEDFERYKNLTEILAITAAGVAIAINFILGWQFSNMDVSVKTDRSVISKEEDFLAVEVYLEKGEHESLRLDQVQARALLPEQNNQVIAVQNLVGTNRVMTDAGQLRWDQTDSELYRVAPKEKLQFAGLFRVPRDKPCIVEVVLTGYPELAAPFSKPSEWRSSTISLPKQTEDKTKADDK